MKIGTAVALERYERVGRATRKAPLRRGVEMALEEIYRPVEVELAAVEQHLGEYVQEESSIVLRGAAEVLPAGGKRLRPALLLISARACDYMGDRSIRLATAVELIHMASLTHDDVIDGAGVRRGVPSANSRCGNKLSVLVGDHLYAKAVSILAEHGGLEVMRSAADAICKMTDGEIQQTLCSNNAAYVEEGDYLHIIAGKTAALMSCACRSGALLAHGTDGKAEALADFGFNLGMAFQIVDDVFDLVGEEEDMGKCPGSDIREGKLTLPFVHVLRTADEQDRMWLADVFRCGQFDRGLLCRVREMVSRYGGIEYSLKRAEEYGELCRRGLAAMERCEYRDALASLMDYMATGGGIDLQRLTERACISGEHTGR